MRRCKNISRKGAKKLCDDFHLASLREIEGSFSQSRKGAKNLCGALHLAPLREIAIRFSQSREGAKEQRTFAAFFTWRLCVKQNREIK